MTVEKTTPGISMTGVPLLDLAAQNGPLEGEIMAAMARVVRSNRYILGGEVEALESELAQTLGLPHCIGVSSGTDALLVALMALGVGPGDEVITTPFSFFATAGCISRVGATPVFVDIERDTFNIDPSKIEAAINSRTRAILPVHLFGQPCDMAAIERLAGVKNLAVLEDAAQAIGAQQGGRPIGGIGNLGAFSFFPSKNLGAFGDAGMVTTTDAALADRVRVLRGHGAKPKYFHARVGGNFRIDALQAAVLRVKLPHLARWTAARRSNAARYDAIFDSAELEPMLLERPRQRADDHIYNQYVIRTCHRDGLRKLLGDQRIGTEVYYPRPLHLQECFAHLGQAAGSLPVAERAADEVLALPIYPELGTEGVTRVAEAVVGFLRAR